MTTTTTTSLAPEQLDFHPANTKNAITASAIEMNSQELLTNPNTQLSTEEYMQYDAQFSVKGMPSHPVVMARGQGEYLWDLDGKRYIDFNAGFSACNQGHCHPKIVAAMVKQCQLLTMPSRSVHVAQYGMLCKTICELTGFDKIAAMNGGAEAVDLAIKIARSWGYKTKGIAQDKAIVLTASENYHGRTLSILSASTDVSYRNSMIRHSVCK
jgi:ornithine--oxo-acid transaminase